MSRDVSSRDAQAPPRVPLSYAPARDVLSSTRAAGLLTIHIPETADSRRWSGLAYFLAIGGIFAFNCVKQVIGGAPVKRELIGLGAALAVLALVSFCFIGWRRGSIRLQWNGTALVVLQDAARAKWRRRAWGATRSARFRSGRGCAGSG